MQANPRERSCSDDDRNNQSALLGTVLAHHPAILTADELRRDLTTDSDDFERVLRDLTGAGLLRRDGASVLPTRAALHFDWLGA
jgi:hypothetical protein